MVSNDKYQGGVHLSGVRVSIRGLTWKRTVIIMRLCSLWSATFIIARARAARFLSIHSSSSFSGLNDFLFVFPIKLISWVFRMLTSNHSAIHPEYLSKTAILVNWSTLVFSLARVLRSFPWTHPRTTRVHALGYLVSAYPRRCWICLGGVD